MLILDRTRHFGRCLGDWPDGRMFEQDGVLFDYAGNELINEQQKDAELEDVGVKRKPGRPARIVA